MAAGHVRENDLWTTRYINLPTVSTANVTEGKE